jgi:hypothetical protein
LGSRREISGATTVIEGKGGSVCCLPLITFNKVMETNPDQSGYGYFFFPADCYGRSILTLETK